MNDDSYYNVVSLLNNIHWYWYWYWYWYLKVRYWYLYRYLDHWYLYWYWYWYLFVEYLIQDWWRLPRRICLGHMRLGTP